MGTEKSRTFPHLRPEWWVKEAEKLADISTGIFVLIQMNYVDLDQFEDLVRHVRYRSQFNFLYFTRLEIMTGGSVSVSFITTGPILILESL